MARLLDRIAAAVSTTDATVTTLATYTLPTNSVVIYWAKVTAFGSASAQVAGYIRKGVVKRSGASAAALVAAVVDELTQEDVAGWDCTVDVSGNDMRVRVTGAAATAINWAADIELTRYDL